MSAPKEQHTPHSTPEGESNRPRDLVGGYQPILTTYARRLRTTATPWENKLWVHLKAQKLGGFKFRRQQPIGNYIADFYNAEKKLIIELDGSQHAASENDTMRDAALNALGYHVLRIWNNEIDSNLEGVLIHILSTLNNTPHRNTKPCFDSPSRGEWVPSQTTTAHNESATPIDTSSYTPSEPQTPRSPLEGEPESASILVGGSSLTPHHSPFTTA